MTVHDTAREELATLIDEAIGEGFWSRDGVADALIADGYVRVIEDGATIHAIAGVLYSRSGCPIKSEPEGCAACRSAAQNDARAVVRELRGGA